MTQTLAAVVFERGFYIDALLTRVCETSADKGIKIGGLMQEIRSGIDGGMQSVHVVDVRSGEKFDIWEDRGRCATGCRLDEQALTISEKILDEAIRDEVDLLIINRFGRAESIGRGLISSFAQALEADIPLLTSVRDPYTELWQKFHGGLGVELDASRKSIDQWIANAVN